MQLFHVVGGVYQEVAIHDDTSSNSGTSGRKKQICGCQLGHVCCRTEEHECQS